MDKESKGADKFHAEHGKLPLKHMLLLSTSDLVLIADALDILSPEDDAQHDRAEVLSILMRNKIEVET